jgi:hypothetical protein
LTPGTAGRIIPKNPTLESPHMDLLQAAMAGAVSGLFSAGTIWGVLKTKIAYLERDVLLAHTRITKQQDTCRTEHRAKQ